MNDDDIAEPEYVDYVDASGKRRKKKVKSLVEMGPLVQKKNKLAEKHLTESYAESGPSNVAPQIPQRIESSYCLNDWDRMDVDGEIRAEQS